MNSEYLDTAPKTYEIQQIGSDGDLLSSKKVEATSGEGAARQLKEVVDGTDRIAICLDGIAMNEMGIDYWQKRMRKRGPAKSA